MAASVGDFKTVGTRKFRFEGTPEAFYPWSPWAGTVYSASSLAAAKALVPIDDSVDERVVQLQDTTADVVYIYVQKAAGYGGTFDLSFDLLMRSDIGADVDAFTKAEAAAASFASGDFAYVSDIDTGTGFLMNSNGTDLVSGKYWMQLGSSTITGSASVGAIYPFLNQYWECLDATASSEVFKVTDQLDVVAYTSNQTLTAAECKGSVITNAGAGGAVVLTLPTAVAGLHVTVIKDAAQDLTITAGGSDTVQGAASIINDNTGDLYGCIRLVATDATEWKIVTATGGWNRYVSDMGIVAHAATGTAELSSMFGGTVHNNDGASGAVVITSPTEVEGMHIRVMKTVDQNLTFNNSSAAAVIADTTSETDKYVELFYVSGAWVVGVSTGTWA